MNLLRLSSLSVVIWLVLVGLSVAPPPRRNPDLLEVFSEDGNVNGDSYKGDVVDEVIVEVASDVISDEINVLAGIESQAVEDDSWWTVIKRIMNVFGLRTEPEPSTTTTLPPLPTLPTTSPLTTTPPTIQETHTHEEGFVNYRTAQRSGLEKSTTSTTAKPAAVETNENINVKNYRTAERTTTLTTTQPPIKYEEKTVDEDKVVNYRTAQRDNAETETANINSNMPEEVAEKENTESIVNYRTAQRTISETDPVKANEIDSNAVRPNSFNYRTAQRDDIDSTNSLNYRTAQRDDIDSTNSIDLVESKENDNTIASNIIDDKPDHRTVSETDPVKANEIDNNAARTNTLNYRTAQRDDLDLTTATIDLEESTENDDIIASNIIDDKPDQRTVSETDPYKANKVDNNAVRSNSLNYRTAQRHDIDSTNSIDLVESKENDNTITSNIIDDKPDQRTISETDPVKANEIYNHAVRSNSFNYRTTQRHDIDSTTATIDLEESTENDDIITSNIIDDKPDQRTIYETDPVKANEIDNNAVRTNSFNYTTAQRDDIDSTSATKASDTDEKKNDKNADNIDTADNNVVNSKSAKAQDNISDKSPVEDNEQETIGDKEDTDTAVVNPTNDKADINVNSLKDNLVDFLKSNFETIEKPAEISDNENKIEVENENNSNEAKIMNYRTAQRNEAEQTSDSAAININKEETEIKTETDEKDNEKSFVNYRTARRK